MSEPRAPESHAAAPEPRGSARARTCIGCGEAGDPGELVRLVLGPDGEVAVDAAGGGFGRGAHVHARAACVAGAASRGLPRVTRGKAREVSLAVRDRGELASTEPSALSAAALAEAIEGAMARRIAGLLATSVRTRKARIGADATSAAWRAGEAALVVVSTDAAAARELAAVRDAVGRGAAIAWGTRATLAAALMRRPTEEGVAVVAITDAGLASAVRDAVDKAMGVREAGAREKRPRPRNDVKDAATRGGFRGRVEPERAGRASGRHLRRAQESRQ